MTGAAGACLDFDAFEQEAKREPYRPYEMPAWLERDLPPKDYLLGHWLHTTARVLIAADSGIGKTMLALEIAFAVAAGRAFCSCTGRRVGPPEFYSWTQRWAARNARRG